MQEEDVGLAPIINKDLMQLLACHIATDDECVCLERAANVDVSYVEG
jgi:hypothetical protein